MKIIRHSLYKYAVSAAFLVFGTTHAATITVTSVADNLIADGNCTLREAVGNANGANQLNPDCAEGGVEDQIVFDPAIDGNTIEITGSEISVLGPLHVAGNGNFQFNDPDNPEDIELTGAATTLSGGDSQRIFRTNFSFGDPTVLTLSNLALQNGGGVSSGGAIYLEDETEFNGDAIVIRDSQTQDMPGTTTTSGAAILVDGATANLVRAVIVGNAVTPTDGSGSQGGAIKVQSGGQLTINHSLFTRNQATTSNAFASGGAIHADDGSSIVINDSLLLDNRAFSGSGASGGALDVIGPTTDATIRRSVLALNTASGGAFNGTGGAIRVSSLGTLNIINTTVTDNSAGGGLGARGGAIDVNDSTATINNGTITGNNAGSTVTSNTGGLSETGTASIVTISNTVISENLDTGIDGGPSNCTGNIISAGYNFVGDLAGCIGFVAASTDVTGDSSSGSALDAGLGPLSDNGGGFVILGRAIALLSQLPEDGSLLVDGGDPQATCASQDQRGEPRPQDGDRDGTAVCDIGSIEVAGPDTGGSGGSGGSSGGGSISWFLAFYLLLAGRRLLGCRTLVS